MRQRLTALYPGMSLNVLGVPGPSDHGKRAAGCERTTMIKDLEAAMAEGRADLAVHSLKDMPSDVSPGFALAASPRARIRATRSFATLSLRSTTCRRARSSARRAFAARRSCASAVPALVVKAAARQHQHAPARARRAGQLRRDHPRGVMAEARWALRSRIADLIDPDESLPAPGQGALAIECRADRPDLLPRSRRSPIARRRSRRPRSARSRARSRGNCHTPLAAHAEWLGGALWLRGLVASADGREVLRGELDADDRRRRRARRRSARARRRIPVARRGATACPG